MKKLLFSFLLLLTALPVFSQQTKYSIQGKVIDGMTMKPVPFSLLIIKEAGLVSNSRQDGSFRVDLPKPGRYTITVQSQGLQTLTTNVTVEGPVAIDFTLNPFVSKSSSGVTVRGERDLQRVSRQTMTVKEIKEVPASFGDSVGALASLPGVNRSGGFFGPLIIRGADYSMNGYYIDDIPMYKLQHFGGIHSVISNDLMESIDLYSSAYPSQFGNAQAAVININTVDDVKKAGGHTDIGLISANAYFEAPITSEIITDGQVKEENKGYFIGAGRYGYLSLFIPFFYDHIMNQQVSFLPEYWDYQFKAKYRFNTHHSVSLLAFGSKDKINLNLKDLPIDDAADPIEAGMQMYNNDQSFNQALYYTYTYSSQLTMSVMSYASLNRSRLWFYFPDSTQSWAQGLGINSDPNIFGAKEKIRLEWLKSHGEFRGAFEQTLYSFKTAGKTISTTSDSSDLNKDGLILIIPLGRTYVNRTLSGYAENKFSFGWITFVPGVHFEHLSRTAVTTVDPRGVLSIALPTNTTIGIAGGYYSAFLQTNPSYFTSLPNLAGEDLKPQRSIHRSVSLEQKVSIYSFKAEGFYNTFTDIVMQDAYRIQDPDFPLDPTKKVSVPYYSNEGKLRTYGVELLAKIKDESEQGPFGWVSYTYNRSKYITHQSADYYEYGYYGSTWLNSPYDMPHVVKAVTGYTYGSHTLSAKFQYNTSVPYTKIVNSYLDPNYTDSARNVPIYGKPNTARLNPQYQLDLRYSHKTSYTWGYISWYVEAIGIVSSTAQEYKWDYRKGYEEGNPKVVNQKGQLAFLPNFGVEVKF